MSDFYDLLGLKPNATADQIKRAYRRAAQRHHPDMEGGNPELFLKIQEAYETLKDPIRREMYDAGGVTGVQPNRKTKVEARAIEVLIGMFQTVLTKTSKYNTDDLVAMMYTVNDEAREKGRKKRDVLFRDIKLYRNIYKRIEEDHGFLRSHLRTQGRGILMAWRHLRFEMEVVEHVDFFLGGMSYRTDDVLDPPTNNSFFFRIGP